MPARHRTWPRRVTRLALPVVLVALGVAAFRLHEVHDETGEWRLQASESPPRVRFEDRDYRRGEPVAGPPAGTREVGRVLGDTPVLARPAAAGATATVIWLPADGRWVGYGLVGGP
ncbi:hypothetical protein ACFFKU_01075 [Kineococcus gynurae]|uniref:Uncharacterized protein n=1 Tax=Kineococcus gynurae TaxID=452979 RepID=A0ABV5LPW9_9ACTN